MVRKRRKARLARARTAEGQVVDESKWPERVSYMIMYLEEFTIRKVIYNNRKARVSVEERKMLEDGLRQPLIRVSECIGGGGVPDEFWKLAESVPKYELSQIRNHLAHEGRAPPPEWRYYDVNNLFEDVKDIDIWVSDLRQARVKFAKRVRKAVAKRRGGAGR